MIAHDAWWAKVTEAHERSLVGNLVRPEDLYLTPEQWHERLQYAATIAVEQLGIESAATTKNISRCRLSPRRAFTARSLP